MKNYFLTIGLFILATSAHATEENVDQSFSLEQAQQVKDELTDLLGDGQEVLVVCGPSFGKGFFYEAPGDHWVDDGITDGRIAFVSDGNTVDDVIHHDGKGRFKFKSALKNGSRIIKIPFSDKTSEATWISVDINNSVVETHILSKRPDGQYVNLWTTSKQTNLIGPQIKAFTSNCFAF